MSYDERLTKLLPQAGRLADAAVKKSDYQTSERYNWAWNQAFHGIMDELASEFRPRNVRPEGYKKATFEERLFTDPRKGRLA